MLINIYYNSASIFSWFCSKKLSFVAFSPSSLLASVACCKFYKLVFFSLCFYFHMHKFFYFYLFNQFYCFLVSFFMPASNLYFISMNFCMFNQNEMSNWNNKTKCQRKQPSWIVFKVVNISSGLSLPVPKRDKQ